MKRKRPVAPAQAPIHTFFTVSPSPRSSSQTSDGVGPSSAAASAVRRRKPSLVGSTSQPTIRCFFSSSPSPSPSPSPKGEKPVSLLFPGNRAGVGKNMSAGIDNKENLKRAAVPLPPPPRICLDSSPDNIGPQQPVLSGRRTQLIRPITLVRKKPGAGNGVHGTGCPVVNLCDSDSTIMGISVVGTPTPKSRLADPGSSPTPRERKGSDRLSWAPRAIWFPDCGEAASDSIDKEPSIHPASPPPSMPPEIPFEGAPPFPDPIELQGPASEVGQLDVDKLAIADLKPQSAGVNELQGVASPSNEDDLSSLSLSKPSSGSLSDLSSQDEGESDSSGATLRPPTRGKSSTRQVPLKREMRDSDPNLTDETDSSDDDQDEDLKSCQCPFCDTDFPLEWVDIIGKIYKHLLPYFAPMVKASERSKRKSAEHMARFIRDNRFNRAVFQDFDSRIGHRLAICQEHHKRAALNKGKMQGWPTASAIRVEDICERVQPLLPVLDEVVEGNDIPEGHFYRLFCEEWKEQKSSGFRNPGQLRIRLKRARPGYYGHPGTQALSDALSEVYLHSSETALSPEELGPFRDTEFVLQVLLPTAAVLLIREDLSKARNAKVTWAEALKLMEETADYGDAIFPHPR